MTQRDDRYREQNYRGANYGEDRQYGYGTDTRNDDDLRWAQSEAYRHDFWAGSGDGRTMTRNYGTAQTSFGHDDLEQRVTRAVRGEHPEYGAPDDERLAGGHRGRGPKNYRPSDERIRERVSDLLTDDPHIDASNIELTVSEGKVRLEGSVWTRPMKHRVEDMVADCSGVQDVDNRLRVAGTPQ